MTASLIRLRSALAAVALLFPMAADAQPASRSAPAPVAVAGKIAPAPRLAPSQLIPVADLETFVDGVVGDAMAADHLAGAAVTIVQGGKIAMLKGYGMSSVDPVRPVDPRRTLFRIASTSKTFTWTLLVREAEQGRIRLDAPINDYLPPEMRFSDRGFKRSIRVVDLMAHAAGFEDNDLAAGPATNRPDKIETLKDYLTRNKPKRVREPGTLATYSNYGVALAGFIIERVRGMDVATLAERELFGPLKMNDTTYREPYRDRPGLPPGMPAALRARLVTDFKWNGSDFEPSPIEYLTPIGPAGSISMTPADMARYMLMHLGQGALDGARIYGPAAARLLRTPVLKVPDGINGWAHGLMISTLPGDFTGYGHGGAGLASLNYMMWVPELDLGIFIIANTNTARQLIFRFPKLVVEHFYGRPGPARQPFDPGLAAQAKIYDGYYVNTRRSYRGLSQFMDLMGSVAEVSVDRQGFLRTPGQSWVPDGAPGRFRSVDGSARMAFTMDARGRPIRYTPDLNLLSMERAGLVLNPTLFNVMALLTALAALSVLIVALVRLRPEGAAARTPAAKGMILVSALWLAAFGSMILFISTMVEDELMFAWPGRLLPLASAAALLATLGAAALLVSLILDLIRNRSGNRRPAWGQGALAVLYLLFGLLVGMRGGLIPWY